MNISTTDLTGGKDVNYYIELIRGIIGEFPELSNLFDDIRIVTAYSFHFRNGTVDKITEDFLGETTKYGLEIQEKQLGCTVVSMNKRRLCIQVVMENLRNQEERECRLFFRHECCHAIDVDRTEQATSFQKLKEHSSMNFGLHVRQYLREYRAWKCIQRRYGPNELARFLEISAISRTKKRAKNPQACYLVRKKGTRRIKVPMFRPANKSTSGNQTTIQFTLPNDYPTFKVKYSWQQE